MSKSGMRGRSAPGAELSIEKIIDGARKIEGRVAESLPPGADLCEIAAAVVESARQAGRRVKKMKSPLSPKAITSPIIRLNCNNADRTRS